MGEITGPISTLPGKGHDFPEGTRCDIHPDRLAVARIQGETDSFGAELNDMCEQCLAEYRDEVRNADTSGTCEWCKQRAPRLRHRRDYEEGMSGRVYEVCDACIKRENDDLERELGTYWGRLRPAMRRARAAIEADPQAERPHVGGGPRRGGASARDDVP